MFDVSDCVYEYRRIQYYMWVGQVLPAVRNKCPHKDSKTQKKLHLLWENGLINILNNALIKTEKNKKGH